jgi:dihydrofolate reductase
MNKPVISIICALSENRVIGNKNKIPWHIREDLIRFKQKTTGHTVIMGRTTFESVMGYYERSGRPVPNRKHIIVSRDTSYRVAHPGCYVVSSIDEALEKAKEVEREEVFVSGGASIFTQMIDRADRLYLTVVHEVVEGDTYFPEYTHFTKVIGKQDGISEGHHYTFLDLER